MKKYLLMMLLCAAVFVPVCAQDIIVTTSSERIDAQIVEVSETEVRYKKADNPTGPTFVLSTSKIVSIVYANGDVQTFEAVSPQPATTQTVSTPAGSVMTVRSVEDITFVPGQKIEASESRSKYYYGNIEMDNGLYKDFLKLTCPEAYSKLQGGITLYWVGWGFECFGLGMWLGTIRPLIHGDTGVWATCMCIGAAFVGTGIGLCIGGSNMQKKSVDVFNNQCTNAVQNEQALRLNFGVTQNGVGLTLNF